MILTCSLIYSAYTFQHFQTIICITLVCVLDLNTIGFSCVPPVCLHPKKHVVWWYHKHGIPLMATFFIVATLYSVVVHHNIWNLGFQQCFLNSIRNKWSIIIRIRHENRRSFQCGGFSFSSSFSFYCCWCHRWNRCHWCQMCYQLCWCHRCFMTWNVVGGLKLVGFCRFLSTIVILFLFLWCFRVVLI